jgi:predicted glycoside hydrolase/deacetylase ChbG (UPF0249 family)
MAILRGNQNNQGHEWIGKPFRLLAIFLTLLMTFFQTMIADAREIRLIIRGDDFGMTQGSLPAFEKAFQRGVLTCASILVQAPWFEGAAEAARNSPSWCLGVHLSLVGEWRGYRWRPVLPWDRVSSLVDEDGYLYTYPKELFGRKPRIEEIDAELRAQVNLAQKRGLSLHYLDTHYMGMKDYPGLAEVIRKISFDYRLPLSGGMGEKLLGGVYRVPVKEKKQKALEMLKELKPGLWLWICHIGIESPEQEALIHSAPGHRFMNGGAGRHRAAELEVLTSPEVKSLVRNRGIQLVSYRELAGEKKR